MNKLWIIGNLCDKPILRHTQDGTPVCGFTVAVNRRQTAQQRGNGQQPEADFFNVSAWRGLGENAARFLDKGRKVCVTGRVSLRTWENETRHGAAMEVLADDIEFLSPRETKPEPAATPAPVDAASGFAQVETDELPFLT